MLSSMMYQCGEEQKFTGNYSTTPGSISKIYAIPRGYFVSNSHFIPLNRLEF